MTQKPGPRDRPVLENLTIAGLRLNPGELLRPVRVWASQEVHAW